MRLIKTKKKHSGKNECFIYFGWFFVVVVVVAFSIFFLTFEIKLPFHNDGDG